MIKNIPELTHKSLVKTIFKILIFFNYIFKKDTLMKKAAIETSSRLCNCMSCYENYANLDRRNNVTNSITFVFDLFEYKLAL